MSRRSRETRRQLRERILAEYLNEEGISRLTGARRRELRERMRAERRRLEEEHLRERMARERQPKWYHIVFGVSAFFVYFSICWTAAHYLTRFLDRFWVYGQNHPTVRDYAALLLSMFLFGLSMSVVRWIFKPEKRALNVFTMMVDAMQRMSKGDFNVNLEAHPRYAGQYYVLVDNLNRMAAELGQMEQMRQEFISNVSHEIQSPLTAIKGFAQALRQDGMTPEARDHYLRIIETESDRMSRLSDNLMKLTSLESRHHPFQIRTFRLDRQIRQAVLSCEPLWDAKKLEMDVQLSETTLEADEELVNQIWTNLLHNSIKFTPEGGTISIRLEIREGDAEATFADTGIGVSESDLPHLFERFFKVDKSRNRASGGSGLGLSIVKKIVDLHGGDISAQSRPGEGTRFRVRLPLKAAGELSARRKDAAQQKNPS
ncbi:two-component sensor histidine kinase [Cohnella xylanilytica]|uniref:sensor histidine kinase n=1 Tax=Cohnella xylanilytica TaxID=557555 RepID=UPI001B0A2F07|nr:HAMP domain-containing sensor histidine kinase [Cohnella xylanilytica]GIO16068.1 two-component sensor histidine kinase [Cohnella xylanilytica]